MTSSKNTNKYIFILLLICFAGWFIGNYFLATHVSYNEGYGWDGAFYGAVAADFKSYMHNLSGFSAGRIFPELLIYLLGTKVFHLTFSAHAQVVNAFYIYNCVVLIIGVGFFLKLAKHFQWPYPVMLIGFATLFVNFPNLKLFQYVPVLTDPTALTLGIVIAYSYVKNNLFGLLIATFLGAFTFPLIIYSSALLIFFPCQNHVLGQARLTKLKEKQVSLLKFLNQYGFRSLVIIFLITAVLIALQYVMNAYLSLKLGNDFLLKVGFFSKFENFDFVAYPISFFAVLAYFYFLICSLTKPPLRSRLSKRNIFCFLILVLIVYFLKVHYLVDPLLPNANSLPAYLIFNTLSPAIANPFIFIVSHFIYFGPGILLMLIFWNRMVEAANELGTGFYLFIVFYAVLLINSQSRELINALPFFVIMLCQGMKNLTVDKKFAYKILVLSLLLSRFWLPIQVSAEHYIKAGFGEGLAHFPMQLYFMNFGPWVSNVMYLVQFAILLLTLWWLLAWKKALRVSPQ